MKVGDKVAFVQLTSQPGEGMRFAQKQGVIRRMDSNGWIEVACDGIRHRRKAEALKLVEPKQAHA